jgi:hypothetical protein
MGLCAGDQRLSNYFRSCSTLGLVPNKLHPLIFATRNKRATLLLSDLRVAQTESVMIVQLHRCNVASRD